MVKRARVKSFMLPARFYLVSWRVHSAWDVEMGERVFRWWIGKDEEVSIKLLLRSRCVQELFINLTLI